LVYDTRYGQRYQAIAGLVPGPEDGGLETSSVRWVEDR